MNLPTFILAAVIFGLVGYTIYRQIQRHRNGGGCNCSDCSCGVNENKAK